MAGDYQRETGYGILTLLGRLRIPKTDIKG